MTTQSKGVVLITGASSGIGQACGLHLAAQGYRVYGTSRRAAPNPPAGALSMIPMDVTNDASVERAVQFVLDREGCVDVVVNISLFAVAAATENTSMDEAREQLD